MLLGLTKKLRSMVVLYEWSFSELAREQVLYLSLSLTGHFTLNLGDLPVSLFFPVERYFISKKSDV